MLGKADIDMNRLLTAILVRVQKEEKTAVEKSRFLREIHAKYKTETGTVKANPMWFQIEMRDLLVGTGGKAILIIKDEFGGIACIVF